jgi:acetyl-CoA C-acetyltransferase
MHAAAHKPVCLSCREIVPVAVSAGPKGVSELYTVDEPVAKMDPVRIRQLQPRFRSSGGTVTAGNASPITDGAAAIVLASSAAVKRYELPIIARIIGFADAAADPVDFPTAPALAIPKALAAAKIGIDAVDYWEINEAFSMVELVNTKLLGLDPRRVNVFGGAVAIGHPLGASGTRLVVTLLNVSVEQQRILLHNPVGHIH